MLHFLVLGKMDLALRPAFIMKACYPGQTSGLSESKRIRPDPVTLETPFLSDRERMEGVVDTNVYVTNVLYDYDYHEYQEEGMDDSEDAMDEDEEQEDWPESD